MRIKGKQRAKHLKTTPTDPRVFVGLFEIAGYHGRIVDYLRSTGYPISFIEVSKHRFDYNSSAPRSDYKFEKMVSTGKQNDSLWAKLTLRALGLHLFFWAIRKHDVFVFVAGRSFLKNNWDLLLFRLLRKRVVSFVAHGSEARPAFMDGAHWSNALISKDPIRYIYRTFTQQKRTIRRLERFSNLVIAHSLASQLLRKPFVASQYIGLPTPVVTNKFGNDSTNHKSFRQILHAPSDRRGKGSDEIFNYVEKICNSGLNLSFVEIVGKPNAEVLYQITKSDLIVDQMYSDVPLAGLGVEAASLGVAVLVGGYGFDELQRIISQEYLPPMHIVHPDDFENALLQFVSNDEFRHSVASGCKDFVDTMWTIEKVSQRYLSAIVGTPNQLWYTDPLKVTYLEGSGLSTEDRLNLWTHGINRFGVKFLKISHRSDLLRLAKAELDKHQKDAPLKQV